MERFAMGEEEQDQMVEIKDWDDVPWRPVQELESLSDGPLRLRFQISAGCWKACSSFFDDFISNHSHLRLLQLTRNVSEALSGGGDWHPAAKNFVLDRHEDVQLMCTFLRSATVTALSLFSAGLTNDFVGRVFEILRTTIRTTNVQLLHLTHGLDENDDDAFPFDYVQMLKPALASLQKIRTLNLSDNHIGCEGITALAPGLAQLHSLTSLNLAANGIGPKGAVALASVLAKMRSLTSLNLENNGIGHEGAAALAPVLAEMQSLTSLNLAVNPLEAEGVAALAPTLAKLSSLTSLDLCSNYMGAEGVAKLCSALTRLRGLKYLSLSDNKFGVEGTASLVLALAQLRSLASLDLSWNEIGDEGAAKLAEALDKLRSLMSLNLNSNDIGPAGTAALAPVLAQLCSLTSLDLNGNPIGDEGAAALVPALAKLRSLTSLRLMDIGFGPESVVELGPVLAQLHSLASLNIGVIDLGEEGAAALALALTELSSLNYLGLLDCNISRLPSCFSCPSLEVWDYRLNPTCYLPTALFTTNALASLRILHLSLENMVFPPAAICKAGVPAIRSYCRDIEKSNVQLQNNRLVLVGGGGAGKTTLFTALQLGKSNAVRQTVVRTARQSVAAWAEADVKQWVKELSDEHPRCVAAFDGMNGADLLLQTEQQLQRRCPGSQKNVATHISRVLDLLKNGPSEVDTAPDCSLVSFDTMTVDQLSDFLSQPGSLTPKGVATLQSENIDGAAFADLTNEDLKELGLCMGDRKKILSVLGRKRARLGESPYSFLLDLPHVWTEGIDLDQCTELGMAVWDFAGQFEFFPVHHMFLGKSGAVYVLVVDVSKGLDKSRQVLRHWLALLRACCKADARAFGDEQTQIEPATVLVVATHSDTPQYKDQVKKHGHDFVRCLIALVAAQFQPQLHVHPEPFFTRYDLRHGGDVMKLKEKLAELRDKTPRNQIVPASFDPAIERVTELAKLNALWPVVGMDNVFAGHQLGTGLSVEMAAAVLEEKGLVKLIPDTSRLVVSPTAWLSKLVAALFHPLKGLGEQPEPVSEAHVVRVLQERGFSPATNELVPLLRAFSLCAVLPGAGEDCLVFPTLLEQAPASSCPDFLRSMRWTGRRYFCANHNDMVPPVFFTLVLQGLCDLLPSTGNHLLCLKRGFVYFGCKTAALHAIIKLHGSGTGFDLITAAEDHNIQHGMLAVLSRWLMDKWFEDFAHIELLKEGVLWGDEDLPSDKEEDLPSDKDEDLPSDKDEDLFQLQTSALSLQSKVRLDEDQPVVVPELFCAFSGTLKVPEVTDWDWARTKIKLVLSCDPRVVTESILGEPPTSRASQVLFSTAGTIPVAPVAAPPRRALITPAWFWPLPDPPTEALRVLIVRSNHHQKVLDLDREEYVVKLPFGPQPNVDFYSIGYPSRESLALALSTFQPHIIHYCGHGLAEGLVLGGDGDKLLPAAELALMVRQHCGGSLRAVILNCCLSVPIAQQLVEHGCVEVAIGYTHNLLDDIGLTFVHFFWSATKEGADVNACFARAVDAVGNIEPETVGAEYRLFCRGCPS